MSTVLAPSEGCEGQSVLSILASSGFLAIFGVPWLVDASLKSLLSCSCGVLPRVHAYLCVQFSPFYNDTSKLD